MKTLITYALPLAIVAYGANVYAKRRVLLPIDGKKDDLTRIAYYVDNFNQRKTDFIKVENIGDKFRTYGYILQTQFSNKATADAVYTIPRFDDVVRHQMHLSEEKISILFSLYKAYLMETKKCAEESGRIKGELLRLAQENVAPNDPAVKEKQTALEALAKKIAKLEADIQSSVAKVLSEEEYIKFKTFPKFYFDPAHELKETRKNIFVLTFDGDMTASQVEKLREEVSAVVLYANASNGDEVVLRLRSGGGTVTGYGLAAAQLDRLRAAGLKLSVCIDEIAASGGYLMACVGNHLYASPFAVMGSVGVVTTIPNFAERLSREGIEVQDVTAGKYKRVMTPYKLPSEEDIAKTKSDLEDILTIFKSFLASHRPSLDVDAIATGEVWFGKDALAKGLVDTIRTSDDVIIEMVKKGCNVYSLKYVPLPTNVFSSLVFGTASEDIKLTSILQFLLQMMLGGETPVSSAVAAAGAAASQTDDLNMKYLLRSPSADMPPRT